MSFDTKTIYTLLFISDICIAFFLLFYRLMLRTNVKKFDLYIMGKVLQSISIYFFLMRTEYPLVFAIAMANLPLFFGMAFETYSFSTYGLLNKKIKLPIYLLLAIAFSVLFLFNISSAIHIRIIISYSVLALFFLFAGVDLIIARSERKIKLASGVFLVSIAATSLYRIADSIVSGSAAPVFQEKSIAIYIFVVFVTVSYLLTLNFIFLVKEEDENAINESNKLLKNILDSFPDDVFVVNEERTILFSNFDINTSYQGADIEQKCYSVLYQKDSCGNCKLQELSVDNRQLTYEYYDEKADKFFNATHILLVNGNYLTIRKDITGDKKVQQRLKMLSDIVEQSPATIAVTNLEGNLEYVNKAFTQNTGYTAEEAIGQNPRILKSDQVKKGTYDDLWDTLTHGVVWNGEFINKKKNGELYYESAVIAPTFNETGEIVNYFAIKQNITDKKLAEKALKESEEKFRALVESSSDWIWEVNAQGEYTYASPQVESVLGYKPIDIIGKTPFELMPAEEAKKVADEFVSIVKNKEAIIKLENINMHKNGSLVILETSGVPFFDSDNNLLGYRGVDRDITDKKDTEIKLQESTQQLKEAQQIAKIGHWSFDIPNNKLEWSDEIYRIFGIEDRGALPNYDDFLEFIHPDDRILVDKTFKESLIKKAKYEITHRILLKNGEVKYVFEQGDTKYDKNGKPYYSIGTVQDVTEKVIADNLLKENEQALDKYFKLNPIPVGILDLETQKYVRINEAYEHLLGYSVDEVIGKTPTDLKVLTDERFNDLNDRLLKNGRLVNSKGTITNSSGKLIEVITYAELINLKGQNLVYTTSIDMTELNAAKEQLEISNAKLNLALEDKNVLLKEVHHRVKNNMQTISSLLFKQQRISNNNEIKLALQDSIDRISSIALINEQIYRSENFKEIELSRHIHEIVQNLISAYNQPGKEIVLKENTQKVYLSIDRALPCSLIINELISNSLKHGFKGRTKGEISITLENMDDEAVSLIVTDNGTGLPEDFESKSAKSLGMFIIFNLTQRQLLGEIDFSSEKGTKCIIKFRK